MWRGMEAHQIWHMSQWSRYEPSHSVSSPHLQQGAGAADRQDSDEVEARFEYVCVCACFSFTHTPHSQMTVSGAVRCGAMWGGSCSGSNLPGMMGGRRDGKEKKG
jgi:hypothetical protein